MNTPPQPPPHAQPPHGQGQTPYPGRGQQPYSPHVGQRVSSPPGQTANPFGPGYPRRPKPGSRPQAAPTGNGSVPVTPPQGVRAFTQRGVTYFLWRFGDVQMMDALAQQWLRSIRPGMAGVYFLVFLALTFVTGVLTWFFDVRPSLAFATYVGQNAFTQPLPFSLDTQMASTLTLLVIGILSITPNLLEFFTVGLALQGNLAVDLALKGALVFDAVTDAPSALAFAQTVVAYFTPGLPAQLAPVIPWVEVALAAPVLLMATLIIETLFLSFVLATFRLFWHSMSRPKPLAQPRPVRNP